MLFAIDTLKREIRIALDQNNVSAQLFNLDDVDTLSLEEIIESKIADAARIVENNAPAYLLDSGKAFADSIEWESTVGIGAGRILLPDDFLRLVCFQMSDWSRAVSVAIDENDPLYQRQSSRFAGVRGNPQRPVVAITGQPGGLVLEFFSCSAGRNVYVKQARYIAIPVVEEGQIDICEKLKPSVVYYAAYLVAASINDGTLAQNLLNISNELMK